MGTDRNVRRLDAAAAERLLAGQDVGFDDLSALLAAASAPARRHELAGETEALVAFRYAALGASGGHRRRSTATSRWARLASVKVAAVTVAFLTAGVALAAGTGVLPTPFDIGPSTAAPDLTSGGPRDTSSRGNGVRTTDGPPSAQGSPSAVPVPDLKGLCRAYRTQAADNPGKALDNPSFNALISAAGGRDKVDGYCDQLLGDDPGKPTAAPGNPNHPTGPPPTPGAPTQRPTR